jgi:hypothetical protein
MLVPAQKACVQIHANRPEVDVMMATLQLITINAMKRQASAEARLTSALE